MAWNKFQLQQWWFRIMACVIYELRGGGGAGLTLPLPMIILYRNIRPHVRLYLPTKFNFASKLVFLSFFLQKQFDYMYISPSENTLKVLIFARISFRAPANCLQSIGINFRTQRPPLHILFL